MLTSLVFVAIKRPSEGLQHMQVVTLRVSVALLCIFPALQTRFIPRAAVHQYCWALSLAFLGIITQLNMVRVYPAAIFDLDCNQLSVFLTIQRQEGPFCLSDVNTLHRESRCNMRGIINRKDDGRGWILMLHLANYHQMAFWEHLSWSFKGPGFDMFHSYFFSTHQKIFKIYVVFGSNNHPSVVLHLLSLELL